MENIKKAKIQPQAIEVEEIVLGTILIDKNVIDTIISDFSSNLFFAPKNILIATSIIELYKLNTAIDLMTIVSQLKKNSKLEEVGGISYISNLTSRVTGAANISYHIRILQQEALRRNLITIGSESIKNSFNLEKDIFDVFNQTQQSLDNALKDVVNYEIKKVGQIHDDIINESIRILKTGVKSGVPTGLNLVDNVTNGWQKSDLIIIAGRPGMGKTSAVVSMALYPAVREQIPIAVFSLEMSSEQLVSRMQSQFSGVNVSSIVKKQLTDEEIIKIDLSSKDLKNAPLYIDDTPNISLLELKGKVRKLVKENGIKLVIIDYLQLMRSGLKTQSREQEIAEISRGLKSLAKELSIPVIALSQLSRSVEQRGGDKKPMLSDLRESGSIEQDADMVMFCYRPEYYGFDNYEVGNTTFEAEGLFMLIISKHRNGELGEIPLRFIADQTKVDNYTDNISNSHINSTFVQNDNNDMNNFSKMKPNTDFSEDVNEYNPF